LEKKLIFVTGKGGVGKTTVVASLATLAAERGRRTLIAEVDTDPATARIFGEQRVGFEPQQVAPGLFACNLAAEESLRAFVRRFVPGQKIADLILKNRVANIFFRAAPSVMEAVTLDRLAQLVTDRDQVFDTIVVDLPASGHAVTFLNVPKSMARMIAVGELAQHLRRIARLVSDPRRTEVVVVSLPDEIVVNETIELWRKLKASVDTPVRTTIVNGIRTPPLRPEDLDCVAGLPEPPERLLATVKLGLYWKTEDERNRRRLEESVDGRVITTPFVFDKQSDADLVARMVDALRPRLAP